MPFINTFSELEQKVEYLVTRYTKLKDNNDALRREVAYLRRENQRLQREQEEVEDRISRIIDRVQGSQSGDEDEGIEDAGAGFADEDGRGQKELGKSSKRKPRVDLLQADEDDTANIDEGFAGEDTPSDENYRS